MQVLSDLAVIMLLFTNRVENDFFKYATKLGDVPCIAI